jgi:DNA-binding MarR family transcriptional regulator
MRSGQAPENITRLDAALVGLTKALIFRDRPPAALADLPLSQLRCVRMIGENEGAKMQDLAHQLYVTLPALSQIVDRLVRRNMVERRPDEADRRIVRLHLTESAREMFRLGREERLERIRVMARNLTREETESGVLLLERMARFAEQARNPAESGAQMEGDGPRAARPSMQPEDPTKTRTRALSPTHAEAGQ